MQKCEKLIISIILLISITLSLASCGLFTTSNKRSRGYTGGLGPYEPHFYDNMEIHWMETFEEAMEAIEHLEAAGNKIPYRVLSSYENELVDAKYCIHFSTYGSKRLKRGQNWYDREQINELRIVYYGFLDKITIEELEHSYIMNYRCFKLLKGDTIKTDADVEMSHEHIEARNHYGPYIACSIVEKGTKNSFAGLNYENIEDCVAELPEDFHEEFVKTIIYIGEG